MPRQPDRLETNSTGMRAVCDELGAWTTETELTASLRKVNALAWRCQVLAIANREDPN
jgi:hypothetical protein